MQLLQPEIKEIQKRYKGDAMKARVAQQELFKERGVSPLAGCLPLLLQMPLLFIMYSVIQNGLTNVDPTAMLTVFGVQVVPLDVHQPQRRRRARRGARARASTRSSRSSARRSTSASRRRSSFAIVGLRDQHPGHHLGRPPARPVADDAAAATRPEDDDPNTKIQRQTMLFLPLISVVVRRLPAGRPVHLLDHRHDLLDRPAVPDRRLGRDVPALRLDARRSPSDHTPRFPVSMPPPPEPGKRAAILTDADKKTTADKTIRPRERGRQGRRGRRR